MASRIGPHAESPTAGQTAWAARAAGAKAFRVGPGFLRGAAAANPAAVLVYRAWPDTADANAVIGQLAGFRAENLYVELRNEPAISSQRDGKTMTDPALAAALFAEIEAGVSVCRAAGVRLAACSLGTGQPEPDFWAMMAARNWCGLDPARDAVALHEYSVGGEIDGWNMGRFVRLVEGGWTGAILITETGVDRCGQPACGWRTTMSAADFDGLLQRYDALLAQYPQVRLATVFSADSWPSFLYEDPNHLFNGGGTEPMATPSNDTLQAQNGLNAKGEYDLAQALISVMNGDKATATALLFDGAESTFGQLNAINPAAFPVPSRPS